MYMKNIGMKLLLMALISFAAMYGLMYMMVDVFGNVIPNINQLYMAGVMTAVMVIIEVIIMGAMYKNKVVIIIASIVLGGLCFIGVRQQIKVSDKEFLKSMIPHHAAALLMCQQADLQDPEIQNLCDSIVSGQQSEIDWMKMKLNTLY